MPFRVIVRRGDYYRGDYYRGDPGLFSFLGNVFKTVGGGVLGAVTGFAKGGIVGGIEGGIAGLGAGGASVYKSSVSSAGANPAVLAAGGSEPAPGFVPHLPGGTRPIISTGPGVGIMRPGGGVGMAMVPGGGGGGGRVMRPSGKGYYTARHLHALQMGRTRARPRMNPFNPSALRRASRRAHAFLRMSRKLVRYYVGKTKKGKAYIGKRKK